VVLNVRGAIKEQRRETRSVPTPLTHEYVRQKTIEEQDRPPGLVTAPKNMNDQLRNGRAAKVGRQTEQ
jgi:hypothetical protein